MNNNERNERRERKIRILRATLDGLPCAVVETEKSLKLLPLTSKEDITNLGYTIHWTGPCEKFFTEEESDSPRVFGSITAEELAEDAEKEKKKAIKTLEDVCRSLNGKGEPIISAQDTAQTVKECLLWVNQNKPTYLARLGALLEIS